MGTVLIVPGVGFLPLDLKKSFTVSTTFLPTGVLLALYP
jgi:hypothetical protein